MSDSNNNGSVPPVPPSGEPQTPPSTSSSQPGASGYAQPGASGYAAPGAAGYAQTGASGYSQAGPSGPSKTLSLIGMIVGIVGLLGFWVVFLPIIGSIFGLFLPVAAVVLGFLGKKKEGLPAKPFWLTALITGFVGIGIALIALVGWIAIFAAGSSMGGYQTF